MNQAMRTKMPGPQERLDLILTGLARRVPILGLCREAGVSRELFYRWMGRVKEASLRALEAQAPGPKELKGSIEPEELVKKLRARIEALEKEKRGLSKERNHLKLVVQCAQRVIKRQGWGPIPRAGFKKNGMRRLKRETATAVSGVRNAPWEPRPVFSPNAGEYPEGAIGGGSAGGGSPDGRRP